MSTKAVIIALLVALVLGVGAYVALQPAPKPAPKADVYVTGEQVLPLDVGRVTTIEIEGPDGTLETITRGDGGVFSLVVSRQSTPGPAWPLEDGRVTSLLRVLTGARSLNAPDEQAVIDEDASRVTIRQDDGKVFHMLLSGRTLTGRGLIKIVEGTGGGSAGVTAGIAELREKAGKLAFVDDQIHNAFRQPGPRAWRSTVIMPSMGPEVSRIRLTNNDLTMRLARLEGKWMLQDPVAAPADPARVARLIGTLGAMRITSFVDNAGESAPGSDVTGLETPLAVIVGETDRRVLSTDPEKPDDVSVRTETMEVLIGNPADSAAQTRYASLGRGGPVVVISGAGLVRELFDPVEYVSRRAVQTPAMDIGMIVLEPVSSLGAETASPVAGDGPDADAPKAPAPELPTRVFRRDLDKWKEVAKGSEVSLDDTMSKAMGEFLKFITSEEAASVAFQAPAIWSDQGQMLIGSIAGTPLETVTIGATDGANLGVRTSGVDGKGSVYRWYPREKVPPMLMSYLPRPTEAVTPTPEQIQKEIMK